MSFLSSIFPASSGTPHNAGSSTIAQPTVPVAPAPVTTAPAVPAAPEVPAAPVSPLDQFKVMWETPRNADGTPMAPSTDTLSQPLFNFDPAKVADTASKMNFAGAIPQETITKALSGDATAFAEAINKAVQTAVVGMTMNQGQLINQAVVANNQRLTAEIPTHIKKAQVLESTAENPVFSHPAAQPLVNSLKQMALARNPGASAAEINKQVSDYLVGFSAALTESSKPAAPANAPGEQDWSSFLA